MPNQSNRNEWTRTRVWMRLRSAGAVTAITLAACSGQIGPAGGGDTRPIGSSGAAGTGGPVGHGVSGASAPGKQGASLAPARLSLISDDQYRNIVHAVFGVTFPTTTNVTVAS